MRPSSIWLRNVTRIGGGSAALGHGLPGTTDFVPDDDIDREQRPSGAVDIGADQRAGVSAFE